MAVNLKKDPAVIAIVEVENTKAQKAQLKRDVSLVKAAGAGFKLSETATKEQKVAVASVVKLIVESLTADNNT